MLNLNLIYLHKNHAEILSEVQEALAAAQPFSEIGSGEDTRSVRGPDLHLAGQGC